MHDISGRIADVLLEIEAVLRTSGKWQRQKPAPEALNSVEPFCIDTLSFEQWLQWVFLPRMKEILEHSRPMPAKSGILSYAQDYFREKTAATAGLLSLIKRFDDLITIQAGGKLH